MPSKQVTGSFGFGTPRNTPAEIVDKLNMEINAALADSKIKALLELGGTALPGSPADFSKLIADKTEKWSKVVKFAKHRDWQRFCSKRCRERVLQKQMRQDARSHRTQLRQQKEPEGSFE